MKLFKQSIFFNLLRIDNWIKNILIFFPCFFGKKITNYSLVLDVIIAALIFCLLTSCVYIINDLIDAPKDRKHPIKKNRPIAAKRISAFKAFLVLCILLIITSWLSLLFLSTNAIYLLCFYLFFNILYSLWLKNILIIDFFAVAIFFEIRLFLGSIVSDVVLSHWLVLVVFFLAALIAIGKRRDDLLILESTNNYTRETVKYYNIIFLDAMVVITSSLLVFIYIIYSVSDWVILHFGPYFYLSDIFVILCLSKYLYILFVEKKSGNPIKLIFNDHFLLICSVLWFLSIFIFIYYV